jgi:hypothetical protein
VLRRINEKSTQIDKVICQVETIYGPLADLALDDKVDDLIRQRFDRLDDSFVSNGKWYGANAR